MSQQRDLVPKEVPKYWGGRAVVLFLCALVAVVFLSHYLLQTLPQQRMDTWPVSNGIVTETRVTVSHIFDGKYGGRIYLRPDIRVQYSAAGTEYNRWFCLPERSDLTHEQMGKKLAELVGKSCQVHWKDESPLRAYVTESLDH